MEIAAISAATSGSASTNANSSKQTTATDESSGSTVKLSAYARAKNLKGQGLSDSTIAAELGLTTKTVESYFGTSSTTAAGSDTSEASVTNIAKSIKTAEATNSSDTNK